MHNQDRSKLIDSIGLEVNINPHLNLKELQIVAQKIRRLSSEFQKNGVTLNLHEALKVLLLNLDNPTIKKELLELYTLDSSKLFKEKK